MNEDVIYCYLLPKSFSNNFFPWPCHWKVIWRLVCGSEDRMDERRVSLGHSLCFKAVWETARGEEFISSSEQSRAETIRDLWEEFKGIISKELEDDSHWWDWESQILRRYWGELISQRRAESLFSWGDNIRFRVNKLIAALQQKQRTALNCLWMGLNCFFMTSFGASGWMCCFKATQTLASSLWRQTWQALGPSSH